MSTPGKSRITNARSVTTFVSSFPARHRALVRKALEQGEVVTVQSLLDMRDIDVTRMADALPPGVSGTFVKALEEFKVLSKFLWLSRAWVCSFVRVYVCVCVCVCARVHACLCLHVCVRPNLVYASQLFIGRNPMLDPTKCVVCEILIEGSSIN